jgi:preprotein translocase subunit SecE
MYDYKITGIWVGVIAVVFAVLWFTGNLVKLRNYVLETREELRKCSWPTWDELKGSTVVVMASIVMLAAFTIAVDYVLVIMVKWMARI